MPSVNLDIIFTICTYLDRKDIKTLASVDSIISNVVTNNRDIYMNKCNVNCIKCSPEHAEVQYEQKRFDRCNSLYFIKSGSKEVDQLNDPIKLAEGVSNINIVGESLLFVCGKSINYVYDDTFHTVYTHHINIKSVSVNSLNVYIVDDECNIFVIQPNIKKATFIANVSLELLNERFLCIDGFTGCFMSSVNIDNGNVVCKTKRDTYLLE